MDMNHKLDVEDILSADTALLQTGLEASLLACGQMVSAPYFLEYASTIIAMRNEEPELAEKFYKLGICSIVDLLRSFLQEASQRGLIPAEDVETAAEQLFWTMSGSIVLRALFLGELLSEEDVRSAADQAVSFYLRSPIMGEMRPPRRPTCRQHPTQGSIA